MSWRIDARHTHPAVLEAPLSKSDAHRALVINHALGKAVTVPDGAPNDVVVLARGLKALQSSAQTVEIDCEDAGAPFRFLISQAAILPGKRVRFTGTQRLGERPILPLLNALGLPQRPQGTPWHLDITGEPFHGIPSFSVDVRESSQFASSLVLAAASLARRQGRAWTVNLDGNPTSSGYLDLTLQWLMRAGFRIQASSNTISILGIEPADVPAVPADWSALGYLLLCAWKTGSRVTNVDLASEHPDRAIVDITRRAGLELDDAGHLRGVPRDGIEASARDCPDLIPTLAAWACTLPRPSRFSSVGILREKESDRLEGIMQLCSAVGAAVYLVDDTLTIHPSANVPERFRVDAARDHRRVMSAVTLAVLTGSTIEVDDVDCVAKSFPGFFGQMKRLGVTLDRC